MLYVFFVVFKNILKFFMSDQIKGNLVHITKGNDYTLFSSFDEKKTNHLKNENHR